MKKAPPKSFNRLALYYDDIYSYKNYDRETVIINKLIQKYLDDKPKHILDVGCGTGGHLVSLARGKHALVGVDMSQKMLNIAKSKKIGNTKLHLGDARNFRLNEQFDVAISLFHVLSYQIRNSDVQDFFSTLRAHIKPSGLILFDCWYGPGVLENKPTSQYKMIKTKNGCIHRFKKPTLRSNQNSVDVRHIFLIEEDGGHVVSAFEETHSMRYFFYPEIDYLLQTNGFKLLSWGGLAFPLKKITSPVWEIHCVAQRL